ncbi:hypothetical protein HPB52_015024 [Rhipicephalus sanguineus]|uniref:Uncharacterized protein n=1 Tax=Rhipicephalus sanguineus TaxID=34632 RepID=A0A9D4SZ45_RHISA|nr:hypothetical protein HPB52_015024 [Rhipicephalus sanguineus]
MKTLISMDALAFVGKPSALFDETNPDWAPPSLRLGYSCKHALRDMSAQKSGVMKNGKRRPNGAEHRPMRVDEAECGSLPMTVLMQ